MERSKYSEELKVLGLKIKELRSNLKFTQETLASLCDLDVRTIQRIEKGQQNITISVIFDLSKNLEIEPDILIKCSLNKKI